MIDLNPKSIHVLSSVPCYVTKEPFFVCLLLNCMTYIIQFGHQHALLPVRYLRFHHIHSIAEHWKGINLFSTSASGKILKCYSDEICL